MGCRVRNWFTDVCICSMVPSKTRPQPSENSVSAAKRSLDLVKTAGPDDLVLVLLSGGASALWSANLSFFTGSVPDGGLGGTYRDTTDFYHVYLAWAIAFFLAWLVLKSTFISNVLQD